MVSCPLTWANPVFVVMTFILPVIVSSLNGEVCVNCEPGSEPWDLSMGTWGPESSGRKRVASGTEKWQLGLLEVG
jgi:hypothetical protein